MSQTEFFLCAAAQLRFLQEAQHGPIARGGILLAEAIERRGAVLVYDTGHMLQHEAYKRAGGLAAFTPFSFALQSDAPVLHRQPPPEDFDRLQRTITLALQGASVQPGDVLILNSNSGYSARVIELALQARTVGLRTIGIASRAQMAECAAAHPSGAKLDAAAEVFIDNGSPYGDAALPVPGNEAICPLSGIGSALILWAIQAEAVAALGRAGIRPTIYRSVHAAGGGDAFMQEQARRYAEDGR